MEYFDTEHGVLREASSFLSTGFQIHGSCNVDCGTRRFVRNLEIVADYPNTHACLITEGSGDCI